MGTTIIITDDNFDHWVGIEYHSMEKRLVSGGLGTSPNNVEPSQLYEATKLTFTVRAVSLEPFRAVTLVGAWSVGAVGVGVTRLLSLAFIDIWEKHAEPFQSRKLEMSITTLLLHRFILKWRGVKRFPSPRDIGVSQRTYGIHSSL